MYVNFPPRDLNSDPYPSHPASTYTCGDYRTKVCGGHN